MDPSCRPEFWTTCEIAGQYLCSSRLGCTSDDTSCQVLETCRLRSHKQPRPTLSSRVVDSPGSTQVLQRGGTSDQLPQKLYSVGTAEERIHPISEGNKKQIQ